MYSNLTWYATNMPKFYLSIKNSIIINRSRPRRNSCSFHQRLRTRDLFPFPELCSPREGDLGIPKSTVLGLIYHDGKKLS
jgi:hypothetical protein